MIFLTKDEQHQAEKIALEVKMMDKQTKEITRGRWVKFSRSMLREAIKQLLKIYVMWEMKNGKTPSEILLSVRSLTEESRILASLEYKHFVNKIS